EVALYHYLRKARKACRVYNPDPLPKRYQFLDQNNEILLGGLGGRGKVKSWNHLGDRLDLWIIVDTNDPRRLGKLWELSSQAKKIVFLDHHPEIIGGNRVERIRRTRKTSGTNGIEGTRGIKYPPHAMLISDPTLSSIGELLYRLFNKLNLA